MWIWMRLEDRATPAERCFSSLPIVRDWTEDIREAMSEGLASPGWVHPFRGMTTSERFAAAGLLRKFDKAILASDRAAAVELLIPTELDRDQACAIVDILLRSNLPTP